MLSLGLREGWGCVCARHHRLAGPQNTPPRSSSGWKGQWKIGDLGLEAMR